MLIVFNLLPLSSLFLQELSNPYWRKDFGKLVSTLFTAYKINQYFRHSNLRPKKIKFSARVDKYPRGGAGPCYFCSMMSIETFIAIAGAFGGLEALKWLASLRSSRKKSDAEAADSIENVIAKRVKTYEDSILFLQNQLQEKERQFADLSSRFQEKMQRELDLTRQLGELRLRYRQVRCDRKECENRKPPFPWLKKSS